MTGAPQKIALEEMSKRQVEALRRAGGTRRMAMVDEINRAVRTMMRAGVQHDHPDWCAGEVEREVLRRVAHGGA